MIDITHILDKMLNEARGGSKLDVSTLDSPRQALTKIHQLTGTKLKTFISDLVNGLGKDTSLLVKTTPKIDGHPFRAAWIDGKAYIETSYSGLMGAEELQMQRVPQFEKKFFEYINKQNSAPLFAEIKKYGLSGIKVIGELLANGEEFVDDNKTITYVGTTYDATKLGSIGSLVVIDIKGATLDGLSELNDSTKSKIMKFLATNFSDSHISYFDINQFAEEINITESDFPVELIQMLKSTPVSKIRGEEAENIKLQINAALTEVFKKKFSNPSLMKANDGSLEGVAFELNGNLYGIHYQTWKDIRTGYYKEIDEAKEFVIRFLAKLAGKSPDSPKSKIVDEIRQNFDKCQAQYSVVWKEWLKRKDELINRLKNATDLPKFVQSAALNRAQNLEQQFSNAHVTSDLNSVLDMVFKKPEDMHGKTIAIIPGSFRPPHKGHFELIKHYSKLADEVYVVVSGQTTVSSRRPDKFGRTMPNYVAGQIIKIYCEANNLTNVNIRMAMRLMSWVKTKILSMSNVKILLGVSGKDDESRFSHLTSERFAKARPDIEILPIDDNMMDAVKSNSGSAISATDVRNNIDNNEFLTTILPSGLSKKQTEEVLKLMNPPSGKYPPMTDKAAADKLFAVESIISESGHMFDDTTRINQENVKQTLTDIYSSVFPALKLQQKYTALLGSAGKKKPGQSSGDIDVAIDFTKAHFSSIDDFLDKAENVAKSLNIQSRVFKPLNLCSYRWPIANVDGKQPDQFVQVDLLPTDKLEMLRWGMYSPSEEEYSYKGACRNQLISAIARHFKTIVTQKYVDANGNEQPFEWIRYSFIPNEGLFQVSYSKRGKIEGKILKNPKKLDKKLVSNDPEKIAKFIFGKGTKSSDILTCDDVWNRFKKMDIFSNEAIRDAVIADTINQLDGAGITYPPYLKSTLKNTSLLRHQLTEDDNVDSANRVAVIVTDGVNALIGRSPQSKATYNGCDLFKGHAHIGENLIDAAKREVYEESNIELKDIEQISAPLKYRNNTTLTFFKAYVDELPDPNSLKCNSFFEYNGQKYPEIVKYYSVSIEELPKQLYKGLAKLIVDNNIIEKLLPLPLNEGGAAVSEVVRINRQNVDATLESIYTQLFPLLHINKSSTAVLGSAGKKSTSGDIDIGIDDVQDIRKFLSDVEKICNAHEIESRVFYGLNEISIKWPIANVDGKQPDQFVQVDLMPAIDLNMLIWGMHSPTEQESTYKGVVRNLLLCDIASYKDRKILETAEINGEQVDVVYERYVLLTTSGLYRKTYSYLGKKPGTFKKNPDKLNSKFVTSDPQKIVKLIFGGNIKPEDVLTIDGLWAAFKTTPMYKDSHIRSEILKKTIDEIKSRPGLKYPSYMDAAITESYCESITESLIKMLF